MGLALPMARRLAAMLVGGAGQRTEGYSVVKRVGGGYGGFCTQNRLLEQQGGQGYAKNAKATNRKAGGLVSKSQLA